MKLETSTITTKEFELAVQILRWTFEPVGVWPLSCSAGIRALLFILTLTVHVGAFIPGVLYFLFMEKDLFMRLELILPLIVALVTDTQFCFLKFKNRIFHVYLTHIAIDWYLIKEEKYRKIMIDITETSRSIMIFYVSFMLSSATLYCSYLAFSKKPYIVRGNDTFFHLPVDSYFVFFEVYQKKYFFWAYVIQTMIAFSINIVHTGICTLNILGVLHISSQCLITNSMLKNLAENFNILTLGKIIRHHWRSLKLVYIMQDLMNEIYLLEFSINASFICFVGYYLTLNFQTRDTSSLITYSIAFTSFIMNIFIFCYLGEFLTAQFESVGTQIMMLNWDGIPTKQARNFFPIILFTHRPVFLSAGKVINFSLHSFTQVIKVAMTYLNMLRTLTL